MKYENIFKLVKNLDHDAKEARYAISFIFLAFHAKPRFLSCYAFVKATSGYPLKKMMSTCTASKAVSLERYA